MSFLTGETAALLRRGGFVWYGGFLGAGRGDSAEQTGGVACRFRFTAEICARPLALGYALGRVGCFLPVNDDYGIPSSLPWAMKFPAGLPPTTVMNLEAMGVKFPAGTDPMQVMAVHPTQIYETTMMPARVLVAVAAPRSRTLGRVVVGLVHGCSRARNGFSSSWCARKTIACSVPSLWRRRRACC
jgi:phosphatidylglycerol:prolipoprotein diacylglycerol transferase